MTFRLGGDKPIKVGIQLMRIIFQSVGFNSLNHMSSILILLLDGRHSWTFISFLVNQNYPITLCQFLNSCENLETKYVKNTSYHIILF